MKRNDSTADEATRRNSWLRRWVHSLWRAVSRLRAKDSAEPRSPARTVHDPKVRYVNWWRGSALKVPEENAPSGFLGLVVAATAAVVVSAGYLVYFEVKSADTSETIVTSANESRTKTLPDGSVVSVGAGSQVRLEERERRLQLLSGQVDVTATPNVDTPFVVETRLAQATTAGATFRVTLDESMLVQVFDGDVDVSVPGKPPTTVRKGNRYRVFPERSRSVVAYERSQDLARNVAVVRSLRPS